MIAHWRSVMLLIDAFPPKIETGTPSAISFGMKAG